MKGPSNSSCSLAATVRSRAIKDCRRSRAGLALDLLTLFFSYKTFPNHYGLCRLWEADRKDWKYYYGSNYLPHQLARLKKTVQPLEYRVLFNDKYICALLCQALGIRIPLTHGILTRPTTTDPGLPRGWRLRPPEG